MGQCALQLLLLLVQLVDHLLAFALLTLQLLLLGLSFGHEAVLLLLHAGQLVALDADGLLLLADELGLGLLELGELGDVAQAAVHLPEIPGREYELPLGGLHAVAEHVGHGALVLALALAEVGFEPVELRLQGAQCGRELVHLGPDGVDVAALAVNLRADDLQVGQLRGHVLLGAAQELLVAGDVLFDGRLLLLERTYLLVGLRGKGLLPHPAGPQGKHQDKGHEAGHGRNVRQVYGRHGFRVLEL